MEAGKLRESITFSSRTSTPDEYGNPETGGFTDEFTVSARVRVLKGGEGVLAVRLQGTQPVLITVRSSPDTKQITTEWRAVDANDASKIYNIRAVTPDEVGDAIDLLCEQGVAV